MLQPDNADQDPHRAVIKTEDLRREPDGIPHAVIGLTALFCVMLAMLLVGILTTRTSVSTVTAIVLTLCALPLAAVGLQRKATRERDHDHPSI